MALEPRGPDLRDSLSKSSPIQVNGWAATSVDTSTSWTSCVDASTISLELACQRTIPRYGWSNGIDHHSLWFKLPASANEYKTTWKSARTFSLCGSGSARVLNPYLVDGKGHDDIGLLVDDFSFAPWVAQISLHLVTKKVSKQRETGWLLWWIQFRWM